MIIDRLLSLIAPHLCYICRIEGAVLCSRCAQTLPKCPSSPGLRPTTVWFAATTYTGVAKQLVHALKFTYARRAATDAALLMVERFPEGYRPHVITYIPTATSRMRARGYDQARLIAVAVSRELALPCVPLLGRMGQKRQVGQDKHTRAAQLNGAFRPLADCSGQHVLLVDDVLTTGSTVSAASSVLYAAGAARVDVAVFARAVK